MNRKLKNALLIVLTIIGLIGVLIPFIYWVNNPELTEMQLFLKWWWIYIIIFGDFSLVSYLINKK